MIKMKLLHLQKVKHNNKYDKLILVTYKKFFIKRKNYVIENQLGTWIFMKNNKPTKMNAIFNFFIKGDLFEMTIK